MIVLLGEGIVLSITMSKLVPKLFAEVLYLGIRALKLLPEVSNLQVGALEGIRGHLRGICGHRRGFIALKEDMPAPIRLFAFELA